MFSNKELITDTDSYKASHPGQFPPGTDYIADHYLSRGGLFDKTLSFGAQGIIKRQWMKPINHSDVTYAKELITSHGEPFPEAGWRKIVDKHGGYLPIRVRAPKEGSVIPTHNVLMTCESLDPELFWLPGWMETQLMRSWYPITVGTTSYHCKEMILEALQKSADDPASEVLFKLHDFGSRGVSSRESAMIGGAAHLVNFLGTDTMIALQYLRENYGCQMAGFSIPAAEHRTVTSWGKKDEVKAYRNMVEKFGHGLVAVVSDSYDLYNAVRNLWGKELRDIVLAMPGMLIVRPDSGTPHQVVVETMRLLEESFGSVKNKKGYKVLNKVRVIQGDGIKVDSIPGILSAVLEDGFSTSNLAMGMGGGLLQQCDRDTQKMACKASFARVNGEYREVFKDPVTDPGKRSLGGYLDLLKSADGTYSTVSRLPEAAVPNSAMEVLFEGGNGKVYLREQSLEEIRRIAWAA